MKIIFKIPDFLNDEYLLKDLDFEVNNENIDYYLENPNPFDLAAEAMKLKLLVHCVEENRDFPTFLGESIDNLKNEVYESIQKFILNSELQDKTMYLAKSEQVASQIMSNLKE